MAQVLRGANTTAQWYEDTYLGSLFSFLEKAILHSTETRGWPGYSGGASAPNVTYHPLLRSIRQHFSNNRSARALRDPSSTPVRENRDRVWQMEIVAYSDYALARSVGGLWIGDLTDAHYTDIAWALIQLSRDLDLPLVTQVRWAEGQKTYVSGRRLTSSAFDSARGIAAHFHVSGNTHWDVGGFFISRLMAKIVQLLKPVPAPTEEDLVTTQAQFDTFMNNWVASAARAAQAYDVAVNKAVLAGTPAPTASSLAFAGKMIGVLPWWQVLGRHDVAGKTLAPNMHSVMAALLALAKAFEEGGDLNLQLDQILAESIEDQPELTPGP